MKTPYPHHLDDRARAEKETLHIVCRKHNPPRQVENFVPSHRNTAPPGWWTRSMDLPSERVK